MGGIGGRSTVVGSTIFRIFNKFVSFTEYKLKSE